jgi:hypothetical protein
MTMSRTANNTLGVSLHPKSAEIGDWLYAPGQDGKGVQGKPGSAVTMDRVAKIFTNHPKLYLVTIQPDF